MNKRTAIIRTSALGLMLMWSGLALAQSATVEPVEARLMAKSGEVTAAKKGTATMTQDKAASGEAKQLKSQTAEAAKGDSQGEAKKAQAQKGDAAKGDGQGEAKQSKAQKGDAAMKQEKSGSGEAKKAQAQKGDAAKGDSQGEAKQSKAQKGDAAMKQEKTGSGEAKKAQAQKSDGSALRQATRQAENTRIRDQKHDRTSAAERGAGKGSGECGKSETAEHRQERRGAAAGSAGAAKGGGTASGNGAAKGGQS
jgi:hypothetical protein